jgi:predicted N-formylglutamate amidohydrolase
VAAADRILVSCEHAGNTVPARYAALFAGAGALLEGHRGWDAGAMALAGWLASLLGAPLHATRVTRLLVDTNRSLHHRRLFSEFTAGLGRPVRAEILERHYHPHRRAIEERLCGWIAGGGRVLHLAVHSFDPRLAPGRDACDLGLLYDPKRRAETALCHRWQTALHAGGELRVRRNHPYRGNADGLTTHLRRLLPADSYLGIELEANQAQLARADAGRRLRRALAAMAPLLAIEADTRIALRNSARR